MVGPDELKIYFEHGRSWERDRLLSAQRSKRVAWSIAVLAGAVAITSAAAVAMLTPLKSTPAELALFRVRNGHDRAGVGL